MATTAPIDPAPTVTPELVIQLARALAASHDSRAYSRQQYHLAELLAAVRALPEDACFAPIAPIPSVARTVNKDGLRYTLEVDAGFVALRLHDVTGDDALAHLEPAHARQLIADLQAVLAAVPR